MSMSLTGRYHWHTVTTAAWAWVKQLAPAFELPRAGLILATQLTIKVPSRTEQPWVRRDSQDQPPLLNVVEPPVRSSRQSGQWRQRGVPFRRRTFGNALLQVFEDFHRVVLFNEH